MADSGAPIGCHSGLGAATRAWGTTPISGQTVRPIVAAWHSALMRSRIRPRIFAKASCVVLSSAWVATACGGGAGLAPAPDAPIQADAPLEADAAPLDAPDAAPVDSGADAGTGCEATLETLLDITPRRIWRTALDGDHLVASTFEWDNSVGPVNGQVLSVSLQDRAVTPIRATSANATLHVEGGWIYVADGGTPGDVWRYQAGAPPQIIASGRAEPRAVYADGTNVYWSEGSPVARVMMRAPVTGGPSVTIGDGDAYSMTGDATHLYTAGVADGVRRFRKDTWQIDWNSESHAQVENMVLDGGDLLIAPDNGVLSVRPPNYPFVDIQTQPHSVVRKGGLAVAGGSIWVTAGSSGLMRMPRTGGQLEQVAALWSNGRPIIADPYVYFVIGDSQLVRCRPGA